jgi:protein O-GlcNAc transferase
VVKNLSVNKDFELYAYFNNEEEDLITKAFKPLFKSWKIVKHLSDPILTETIRSDKIEILVDLSGYTNGNRIRVLFNKASPIQVSWCGYLASTGMKQIDYIIADKNVILENEEGKYSEKVYKLGKIWTVLRKDHNISPDITIPAIKNNYITFGSFNNIKKINKKVIKIWSEILCSVPNSKLHLISERFNELDFIKYFKRLFFNHGVDYNNLIFEPTKNRVDFLNKYNSIDIALDPFPYAGGTTTLESYWMCVPVLTKTGNYFLSKTSESINQSIGMQEWICANESDYIKKAINFSKDFNSLQKTRDYLIKNRENFIIFNSEDLANELSKAFKDMISIYNNT